jgi:ribonuclease HII
MARHGEKSLDALRRRYVELGRRMPREVEAELERDGRAGAKRILEAVADRRRKNRAEGQRLRRMLRREQALWASGLVRIAGVDEVGMSPLAGPVVAAAVVLAPGYRLAGVDDSKKLDPETRERLAETLRRDALAFAIGSVAPEEIDRINIYWAGLLAMKRAVEQLDPCAEHLLIDARRLRDVAIPQTPIIKGDADSLSIAAASIVAKVHRDALMVDLDREHPGYGFAKHKGYPVREHYRALERLGPTPMHRRSFPSVRRVLGLDPVQEELDLSAR